MAVNESKQMRYCLATLMIVSCGLKLSAHLRVMPDLRSYPTFSFCLQVNGASVAQFDHTEVVSLIKGKSL